MNFDLNFIVKELNQGFIRDEWIEHQIKPDISGVLSDLEATKKYTAYILILYVVVLIFICF